MTEYQGSERRRGGPDRRTESFERVRILIVDDHALFRVGIRGILQQEPDLEIVGEADDPRSALEAAFSTNPDVILMDLSLPAPGGIETTQRIPGSCRPPRSSCSPRRRTRTPCSRRSGPVPPPSS